MSLSIITLAAYLLLGAGAGIIAGLFGLGGGIIIVPALLFLFVLQDFPASILMHLAVATSLVTIIFTAMVSTLAQHRRGAVLWQPVKLLWPGIVLGAIAGALVADYLPSDALRRFFGLFELLVGLQIGLDLKPHPDRQLPGRMGLFFSGNVIGGVSTVLGIGGGTLTVPFLLWCNINMRNAVAVSAACGLPIAVAGGATLALAGSNHPDLPAWSSGYIYWPAALTVIIASIFTAPLGVRLAHSLPVRQLKRLFALVLAIVGLRMLI